MVDGDKKPPMSYIYEAMNGAKEAITKSFLNKEENYEEELKYIDTKWESQLHQSWHAGDIIWIYKFIMHSYRA